MNLVYYVDSPPPTLVRSELLSSKASFQDSAAVESRHVQLARDSSVGFASMVPRSRFTGVTTQMTSVRAPVLSVVQRSPLWPAQLHATFNNSTPIQYLVRCLLIIR